MAQALRTGFAAPQQLRATGTLVHSLLTRSLQLAAGGSLPMNADVRSAPTHALTLDAQYVKRPGLLCLLFIAAYLIVGSQFVLQTPPWQTPDEPAHYNYIRQVADHGRLPLLEMGDYDGVYLDSLRQNRFPPSSPIDAIEYEDYQPPLYYVMAALVYRVSSGSLYALRVFNLLLGALSIALLYASLRLVFPNKPMITLGATGFAALLPMHVAMMAAVNNDGLAEVLVMTALFLLLRWMYGEYHRDSQENRSHDRLSSGNLLLLLGFVLGLGMLTKIYAYVLIPIAVVVVFLVTWYRPRIAGERPPRQLRKVIMALLAVIVPALALAAPLWIYNMSLYGLSDFLGLQWHDQVVMGQPQTADWIAQYGWVAYGERAFGFTFQSFWGVFGWMGVFMDQRIYTALLAYTGVLFLGLLWAAVRMISGPPDTDMDAFQIAVLALFCVMILAVTLSYVAYNVKFVQHQGRYFFWGLLPISTIVALGWREIHLPLQGIISGVMAAVLALATVTAGSPGNPVNKWNVLTITLFALFLLLQPLLLSGTEFGKMQSRSRLSKAVENAVVSRLLGSLRTLAWAAPYLLLFILDLMIPTLYIIPQLTW